MFALVVFEIDSAWCLLMGDWCKLYVKPAHLHLYMFSLLVGAIFNSELLHSASVSVPEAAIPRCYLIVLPSCARRVVFHDNYTICKSWS